ncbi:MAG: hypothetical protein J6X67_02465 [Treponema sp.]|nr:hypothetical protein [Treponema sp.]
MENGKQLGKAKIYDIHCPSCGAPAYYDIKSHFYRCHYCDGKVQVSKALEQHKGFRNIQSQKMSESRTRFDLQKAECTGCGAELVFEKGDALANCAFCGRSLVRGEFLSLNGIPEFVVPFSITKDEAQNILIDWCKKNRLKKWSRQVLKNTDKLTGCYLPYEVLRGPVKASVHRKESRNEYECGGFIDNVFINCSKNLDNLLLDGMEPYDIDGLKEFDFAYVAGHQLKVRDIDGDTLAMRIRGEINEYYDPVIEKTVETKAVYTEIETNEMLHMPVSLPVYYLDTGDYMVAVNGQTGKISVRSSRSKKSYYLISPWWFKGILSAAVVFALLFLSMKFFGANLETIIAIALLYVPFQLIVLLMVYKNSGKYENWFSLDYNITCKNSTSKGGPYVREGGKLMQSNKQLSRTVPKPVFFMDIEGKRTPVAIKFKSFWRILQMFSAVAFVIFFPVILALFFNGFNFRKIEFIPSSLWFILTLLVLPVILIKGWWIELYNRPWIFILKENGKKKRYKPVKHPLLEKLFSGFKVGKSSKKGKKHTTESNYDKKAIAKFFLKLLFKPPVCFAVWGAIAFFCVMVYYTAGFTFE